MSRRFEFLFDVGGANAYLAHKVLPAFCEQAGTVADYVPILLGGVFRATGNVAPMVRYADAPAKWAYEQLELRRFVRAHAIPFRVNPHFPVNTLAAMRVITGAIDTPAFPFVVDTLMAAMWETGRKLDEPEVLIATLDEAGLDGRALTEAANQPAVKARLIANTDAAVARGTFGVPTFYVDGEMFWGKERLAQVEAALIG